VIALVDYGAGNLSSVRKALAACGAEIRVVTDPSQLAGSSALVVPGVGHFQATASLDAAWREAIVSRIREGSPYLGICLGMQWLFDGSDEAPGVPGLGWFSGGVTRLPSATAEGERLKIPHVGWNVVETAGGVASHPFATLHRRYVYFTHTYAAPVTADCAATTEYGVRFAAAVARGRVWGVQFHPEKSGLAGLELVRAFLEVARG
jgi:glutamine amidotransferase